jgi:hypothetical protein
MKMVMGIEHSGAEVPTVLANLISGQRIADETRSSGTSSTTHIPFHVVIVVGKASCNIIIIEDSAYIS